ncbi:predicted protein [Nematostella vectensis]|uniref:Uncharacterized protein n=1 Tax=Nematostella vectensis TaxID=45351 RepID=A7SWS7_NEMVE|nr:predicted protein [Nematostella vectensis]|eukprot:XP_001623933.1 predicted protein [Nematostella vectensis]
MADESRGEKVGIIYYLLLFLLILGCPTRQQNKDYALYLMTVLYNEAWKIEPWETEASNEISDDESDEPIRKRRNAIRLRLVGDELYRFNKYGKGFKLHVKVKV